MRHRFRCVVLLATAFTLGTSAHADLPLTIEDLIVKENETTLEIGLNYGGLYTSNWIEKTNQDVLSMSLGVRHGLTPNTEIYGSIRGSANQKRISEAGVFSNTNGQQWDGVSFGINHRFSPDNETPALLGYLQTELIENAKPYGRPWLCGRTWEVGLSTYRRLDPVVVSLSSGFRYNLLRNSEDHEAVNPGNSLRISSRINLAMNAEISVFWGARWIYRKATKLRDEPIEINATQTSFLFGGAYAVSDRTTLHFDLAADISGRGGSNLGTLLRYTL